MINIPPSGEVIYDDLKFMKIGNGYKLCFKVIVSPTDAKFDSLVATSDVFDVTERQFYLALEVPPMKANESKVFGQQPILAVRVIGSNIMAIPLPVPMWVSVNISANPSNGNLIGVKNVTVSDVTGFANFSNLSIDAYGVGYVLQFVNNLGHSIFSPEFNVRFKNYHVPVIDPSSPAVIHVLENVTASSSSPYNLQKFTATDQDTGLAGTLHYTVDDGSATFKMDRTLGQLSLISNLDRETRSNHSLTVNAVDGAPSPFEYTGTHQVVVIVDDVNDNAPIFGSAVTRVDLPESSAVGSDVTTVAATDKDEGANAKITYSIKSSTAPSNMFTITGGTIKLAKALDLDASEAAEPTYVLTIEATDQGVDKQMSSTTRVEVTVKRVNEFAPVFNFTSGSINLSVNESDPVGTVVYKVVATDADSGADGVITYTVSDSLNWFSIDSKGEIRIKNPLDREQIEHVQLDVVAANKGSAIVKSTTAKIFVYLSDVNDNRPIFSDPDACNITAEDTASLGTTIATIEATDADVGANGNIEYFDSVGQVGYNRYYSKSYSFNGVSYWSFFSVKLYKSIRIKNEKI